MMELQNTGYTQTNSAASKVNKKFLTLHGHNVHHKQEKAFCVPRFEVSRSVITVQQYSCSAL